MPSTAAPISYAFGSFRFPSTTMTGCFGSSMYRTWIIKESDDEDDFHLIVVVDDAELVEWFEFENIGVVG
jgi:hypothetical protein